MRPESAKFLYDMRSAADRLAGYVQGKSREEFTRSPELRDAVLWNFVVIGEALSQLHRLDPECAGAIREWRRVIGFRNQLIHGYGVIDDVITWDIIQHKLEALRADVSALLSPMENLP